jgi:hypothetical protein
MLTDGSVIADQEDLLATVTLGAGHSALACFLPAYFIIEPDGGGLKVVGATPPDLGPSRGLTSSFAGRPGACPMRASL